MQFPQEIRDLADVYRSSQKRLVGILAHQLDLNNSTFYTNRMLTQVNAELKALNEYAAAWTGENIPAFYDKGVQAIYNAFRLANIPFNERAGNANIVQLLTRNSYGMLEDAAHSVGRMIKDEVRKAGVESIAEKMATGSTVKQAKAQLLERFQQNGIVALTDKRGREIKLDSYAQLVAMSTTREATNTGTLETAKEQGYDLVKMSSHSSSCPICAPLEGRVYSITGETLGYPKLDRAYTGEYANIHPNCGHTLSVYIPELDKNVEEQQQFSNRSFEVDERAKEQVNNYNKQQAIRTARRNDRNQYEQYKLANVENLPKSFSGFRASKMSGSNNWQAMRSDYLETQRQIRERTKLKPMTHNERIRSLTKEQLTEEFNKLLLSDEGMAKTPYYQRKLVERFNDGEDSAKRVYMISVRSGVVGDSKYTDTASFNPVTNKIRMDYSKDIKMDTSGVHIAGNVYFHEHGHYIDYTALSGGEVSENNLSHTNAFKAALQKDFDSTVTHEINFLIEDGKTYPSWMPQLAPEQLITYAKSNISMSLRNSTTSSISDIFGGLSENEVTGYSGHSKEYWAVRQYGVEEEAFAGMFEASLNGNNMESIKEYLPNAYTEFIKTLEGVVAR